MVLRGIGLAPGDRLLMVVKDCPEFFYLFWGSIKAGIVPVPVNTLLRAPDLRYMIDDSGCAAVACSPDVAAEVASAGGIRPAPAAGFRNRRRGGRGRTRSWRGLPQSSMPSPTSATDDCFWLYSSGSTGRPKAAVHRHRDIVVTCVHYAVDTLGIREDDVCFSAAKLFFAYGLGNAMTFPLWAGATAVLSDQRPTPADDVRSDRPFCPVPLFRASRRSTPRCFANGSRRRASCRPLRLCVSAGEALPPDILRRWKAATNLVILDGIGSTELLHHFPSPIVRTTTSRVPAAGWCPGYEARILDETGAPAARGEAGRLMVKGASAARCYWNNPQKTAQTMQGEMGEHGRHVPGG